MASSVEQSAAEEPDQGILQHRWLRRCIVLAITFLVAVVLLRVLWAVSSYRVLNAEVARIQSAGEPLYPRDFNEPAIPAERNAAMKLLDATEAMVVDKDTEALFFRLYKLSKLEDDTRTKIAALVQANQPAIELARQARDLPDTVWPIRIKDPRHPTRREMDSYLYNNLRLVRLLCLSAIHYHLESNDGEAVACLLDALAAGKRMGQMPYMNSYLWTLYTTRWMVYTVEELSHALELDLGEEHSAVEAKPAQADQVYDLIAALLDENEASAQLARAVHAERMVLFHRAEGAMTEGSGRLQRGRSRKQRMFSAANIELHIFKPSYRFDASRLLKYVSTVAHAAEAPNWPAGKALMPSKPPGPTELSRYSRPLSRATRSNFELYIQLHFRTMALRRMAATGLAIRLFEIDYDGWPAELEELLPEYLADVPLDPFAEHGSVLGYLPREDPPILYSVGPNGLDEGGEYPDSLNTEDHWQRLDMPFFIEGARP